MNNELINKLTTYYPDDIEEIIKYLSVEKQTTLRVNTIKSTNEEVENILKENNITYHKVSYNNVAYVLENTSSEDIKKLSLYNDGKIYLQSLSSELPPLFLNPEKNELILDMTASPGGKTTFIAALSNNESMITAIEMNKKRAERLKYNIEKQGAKKVTVLNTNAAYINEYFMFDKILLDAPCSGSGTTKRVEINETNINRITKTQYELLTTAVKHLNNNGIIIYSTCSLLKEENEDIITRILKEHKNIKLIPLDLTEYKELPLLKNTLDGTITIKPNNEYEGFFIAKLKKENN